MSIEELQQLAANGENETVEFKETTGQRFDAAKTICAFLNGKGGMVVFGVSRKGVLQGQLVSDTTKRDLFDVFSKFEPMAEVTVEWIAVDSQHTAIVCHVDGGNRKPYLFDGRAYKRIQSSTTVMRQDEYNALLLERGEFRSTWERMPNKELTLDDLDINEVFRTARVAVASGRLDESVVTDDAMALLDHFKVRRDGVLLNAAAVLFGKPELFDYPQCQIKMGWFRGNDCAEFRDNRHVFGHIARLMDEAVAFCFKHLNLSAKINGIEREEELEIPIKALRETLINAFAHRLYDNRGMTVYLAIYDDRVEIKNPGAFPVGFDTEHLYDLPKQESTPRNEVIAHVLYLRKSIETWGRGLKLVADECRRVGQPLPTVEVRNGYVITTFKRPRLENAPIGKGTESSNEISISTPGKVNDRVNDGVNDRVNETQEKILAAIRENQFITQAELSRRIGISVVHVNKNMAKLKNIGLIRRIGSDNNGHWEIIDNANSHHATSDVMR